MPTHIDQNQLLRGSLHKKQGFIPSQDPNDQAQRNTEKVLLPLHTNVKLRPTGLYECDKMYGDRHVPTPPFG